MIPPIPDPLGISSVDLRSVQALFASGRLMKSQSGQLARRATHAVMPIESLEGNSSSGGGSNAKGGKSKGKDKDKDTVGERKTSFRNSTTFVPYKQDEEDDDSNDDDDSDDDDDGNHRGGASSSAAATTVRPSFGNSNANSGNSAGGAGGKSSVSFSTPSVREKK